MFRKHKERRRVQEIVARYPLYPFEDLTNPEVRRQAVDYLGSRVLKHVQGESEYVVRGMNMPDRRHTFPDQRLWQRLRETDAPNEHDEHMSALLLNFSHTAIESTLTCEEPYL